MAFLNSVSYLTPYFRGFPNARTAKIYHHIGTEYKNLVWRIVKCQKIGLSARVKNLGPLGKDKDFNLKD